MILDRYITITIGSGNNTLVISPTSENDVGIASGSLMLEQKIVDGDLEFGRLMSSEFSAQLFNTNQDFQGEPIIVDVTEDNVTTRIFTGIIESSKQDWSNTYRDVIAYDWIYYHREDNIASWWNSFWVSTRTQATVKQIRDSLLTYMGFSALSDTYINDSQVIKNEFQQFTNIKFETIFKMLCEIQLTIPHIKGDGSFELITFGTTTTDISGMYEGSNSEWEDFTTQQITGIGIYDTSSNMVQLVGTNTNVLNIAGNLFLLNMSASQLTTIGNNMLTALTDFTFVPASVKMILSDFSLSLGKKVSTDVGNTYVMQNTYSGSLLVEQTIKGVAYSDVLNGNVPSINDDLITANKIAVVQHDIDGLSTEFGRLENNLENNYSTTTEMNSAIEQSAEGIRTEVSQTYVNQTTYNAEVQRLQDEIDGAIESYTGSAVPTLNNYPANEWTTTTERDKHLGDLYLVNASGGSYAGFYYRFDKSGSTYSWVHIPDNEVQKALADAAEANQKAEAAQATADGIADNLSDNYSTTQQMNSAINQKANEITQTVSTTYETKSDATSKLNTANTNAQGYATQAKNDANSATDSKLTNYYTKTQTDSAITQKANEITLNVSQNYTTKTEFGNLEIGGRNLLRNTGDFKDAALSNGATVEHDTSNDTYYVHTTTTDWGNVTVYPNAPIESINGKTVTISAEVRLKEAVSSPTNSAVTLTFNGYSSQTGRVRTTHIDNWFGSSSLVVNKWVKISRTVTVDITSWTGSGDTTWFSLGVYNHTTKPMDFRYIKVEEGNKATDWSPAPEDASDYTNTKVDGLEIGSVNLVDNKYKYGTNNWGHDTGTVTVITDSTYGKSLNITINGGSLRIYANVYGVWKANQKYTVSFRAKSSDSGVTLRASRSLADVSERTEALTSDWKLYTLHLVSTTTVDGGTLSIDANKNCSFQITNIKLENGDKATSFSLSTSDTNAIAQAYASTAETTAKSYTDAQLQITSSSILSTVEQGYTTKTEFSNLQIGGENRFAMSELLPSSKWTFESSTGAGTGIASISGLNARIYQLPSNGYWEWKSNTDYTISIEAKDTGNGNKLRIHAVGLGESYWKEYELTSDWKKYVLTVTAPSTGITANGSISFYCASSGGSIQVRKPKVEYGNRVTDWSPASEDMSSKSEVQQLSNMVAVKVNSSGRLVTAALGVDPASATSYVKVKADDIDIISNGNIQLTGKSIGITSTNFSVTAAGSITAKAGTIGGWSIDSEKLYKSGTVSGVTYASHLKANELKISVGLSGAELEYTIIRSGSIQLVGQGGNIMKNIIIDGAGEESPGTGIGFIQTPRLVTSLIEPQVDNEVNIAGALLCNSNKNCYVIGALQLGSASSSLNCGIDIFGGGSPYIDFHLNHSSADFTARIVHRAVSNTNYIDFIASSSTWIDCRAKSFANQSSKHVKKNIKNITEAEAKKLLELRPVKFDYKFGGAENQRGLIAEEVNEIMPEMVIGADVEFNKNEPWNTPSIDYSKFVPYLIKMIQIQQKDIDALKNK